MPLPLSGQISLSQVNIELGLQSTAQIALNDTAVRTLFGKASGAISMSDGYGKANEFAFTISSNVQEANLRTLAINAGWDQIKRLRVTVASDVYVWSDNTTIPGLTIDGSFPNGVILVNRGYIIGKGGNGCGFYGALISEGFPGGPAISISTDISIVNNSYIAGGGGGGSDYRQGHYVGGGGGGAGGGRGGDGSRYYSYQTRFVGGEGGSIGNVGQNSYPTGSNSNPTRGIGLGGGAGGGGGTSLFFSGSEAIVGRGGGGGGRILPGAGGGGGIYSSTRIAGTGGSAGEVAPIVPTSNGAAGGGGWGAAGGFNPASPQVPGGSGGKAINLNGYSVTWLNTGTVYGAVS